MCLMIDRLILSRIESLYESSKSSEGGQRRDCVIYSVPLSLLSINPTDSPKHASRSWPLPFLVTNVPEPERPLSPARTSVRPAPAAPYGLAPYGICRQFPHPLSRTRKPPSNTTGQHTFARLGLITSAPSSPARRQCITDIFILKVYDGTHVILLLCFLCV